MQKVYLGIDVGSVSTNLVILNEDDQVIAYEYLRTKGQPIRVVQEGLSLMAEKFPEVRKFAAPGSPAAPAV